HGDTSALALAGISKASEDAHRVTSRIVGDDGVGYAAGLVSIHHPAASAIGNEIVNQAGEVGVFRGVAGNPGCDDSTGVLDWSFAVGEADEIGLEVYEAWAAAAVRADECFR